MATTRVRGAQGSGSMIRRGNGWAKVLQLPPGPDGKRRRKWFSAPTKKEAERLAAEWLAGHRVGGTVTVTPFDKNRDLVGGFLADWIDRREQAGDLARTTATSYRNVINLYLRPRIGSVVLAQLTARQVEATLADLVASGLSPRTANYSRSVLRVALNDARRRDGLDMANVADMARPIRSEHREGRALSLEQAQALMAGVSDHPLHAAFVVSLMLGLRRGEVLGLTWGDVDLSANVLTVRHQLQRDEHRKLVVVATKTKSSVRRLPLPAAVADALRRHRAANPGLPDAFVFTSRGGPVDPDNWRLQVNKATIKHLGESWSPHELRHSAASLLYAAGVDVHTISRMLGHSSVAVTTAIYVHLQDKALGATTEAMDRMFGAAAGQS